MNDTVETGGTFHILERRLNIEVTQVNIDDGILPSEARHKCPVVLALASYGIPIATVKYSHESKDKVFAFMDEFDARRQVKPFSFEVII